VEAEGLEKGVLKLSIIMVELEASVLNVPAWRTAVMAVTANGLAKEV
jgi:hypothetical protein